MKLNGAQAMIRALENENANYIFGYPGAAICPFYDSLLDSKITHILTRSEQGAAHAANGYARVTGKPGVCVVTSGPGATNLITGIATAYMDSIPMVAITGQVSTELIGRDVFQEADITGATAPFCKHSYLVRKATDLPRIFKEAFHIASTGRPGPVLIDVPVDIQNTVFDFNYPESVDIKGYKPNYKGHSLQIKRISDAIIRSSCPVICAGGGVISSGASDELLFLSEKCSIPVTTTLMGIGSIPSEHPLNLGMIGSHGVYAANFAVNNADLLIIIGARAGDRAMATAGSIAKRTKVIHIDIDPAEIGKNIDTFLPVVGDARLVLKELSAITERGTSDDWLKKLESAKMKGRGDNASHDGSPFINPRHILSVLSDLSGDNTIVTTEVGQNQIWAANNYRVSKPGSFITSGGMGTMGFGLPASIGAKIGGPDKTVIAICGDGSFQMSLNELGTIKQCNLGIKIIIFNNTRLGMVREIQKVRYKSRYSQVFLESNPDFINLAAAYGIKGERLDNSSNAHDAVSRMLSHDGPYLLEIPVDPEEPTN